MKQFSYSAQLVEGGAIEGAIEAPDSAKAIEQLSAMGLTRVDVHPVRGKTFHRPIGADDFVFFNEQLAAIAESGVRLDWGLRQLARDIGSARLAQTVRSIADELEQGVSLDQAVEHHAGQLPPMYARVIRAGVGSGHLSSALLNLSGHLRFMTQTRRLLTQALAYPAVVFVIAMTLFCLILGVIVPQTRTIFSDFGVQLPLSTRLLLALSDLLPWILGILGTLVTLGVVGWVLSRTTRAGQRARERLVWRLPLLGGMFREAVRSRFFHGLAFCVNSGLPLPEAVRLAGDATGSVSMAETAERLAAHVEGGEPVSTFADATLLIPPLLGYVISAGSDREELDRMLEQLAQAYELRATYAQQTMAAWLMPTAVVTVGLVIGWCIVALFLPLVQMIESVSG